jgi:hypothetical protein
MSSFTQLTERAEQVMANIQQLQATEKQALADAPTASAADRAKLTQKINEIYQLRLTAYEQLQTMFNEHEDMSSDAQTIIKKQVAISKVVDGELAESRLRLAAITEDMDQKIRMAEVNSYYTDYYDEYKYLAQIVVCICVPLIIFGALSSNGLLPSNIYGVLAGMVMVLGGLVLFKHIVYLSTRSTDQWDVTNWGRMPPNISPGEISTKAEAASASTASAMSGSGDSLKPKMCVGSACCDSVSAYDATTNKCVEIHTTA